jgi:aspartate/methionine/tyrosine aminotransferase
MSDSPPRLSNAMDVRQSVFAALQGQIEAQLAKGGVLIPLQIGDTYLEPPREALELKPEGHRELSIYGRPAGVEALRGALAKYRSERGLGEIGAPHVHVGCGCTHALFCAARAVLDPGDAALIVSPYWPLITGLLQTIGVKPIEVPITHRLFDEPDLDIGALLEAAYTPAVRAIYFVTPNNPDGYVMTRAQLEAIAAFAKAHDLWVFADEVYADFVYDGEHVSIATLPGMFGRTITSFSLSKSHALAGARIGYVVAPERVIDCTRRISNHTIYNVPVSMQRAALAALGVDSAWMDGARRTFRAARDATAMALASIGLRANLPRGGSFFFLDLDERLGPHSLQLALERCIDRGVLLAPGEAFGLHHARSARLCFTGVPEADVLDGVRRLGEALGSLDA